MMKFQKTLLILLNILFLNCLASESNIYDIISSVTDDLEEIKLALEPYRDQVNDLYKEFKWRPIHCAVTERKIHLVKWLIELGAKVDFCDEHGNTALINAINDKNRIESVLANYTQTAARNRGIFIGVSRIEDLENSLSKLNIIIEILQEAARFSGLREAWIAGAYQIGHELGQ